MMEGLRQRRRPPPTAMKVETGKRRKSSAPKSHGGAPAIGVVDHISNLPDDNLCHIISLLPTKDGARTQVLATRWRHLWRSAPLNLDCNGLAADGYMHALAKVVAQILSAHQGPGRRFCIPANHLQGERAAASDSWLRSPALDSLQELEFTYTSYNWGDKLVPPPASAFRFSATLLVFTLGRGHLPDDIAHALHFPLLKQLTLRAVTISDCSLHSLISGCPAIECLVINDSTGFCSMKINSFTLKTMWANVRRQDFKELVIENAPCLRRLLGVDFICGLHVSVISAPKLEALGFSIYQDFPSTSLVFSSTIMKGLPIDNLATAVCTVKILAVYIYNLCLDAFIESLRCFPCLEKLYILSPGPGPTNSWRRKHRNLIPSLDIRLKKVVLDSYMGRKPEVNFATFFVLNAKVLECMTLAVPHSYYNEIFIDVQRQKLQLESRASRSARFHFMTAKDCRLHNVGWMEDVHYMDLRDPFTS